MHDSSDLTGAERITKSMDVSVENFRFVVQRTPDTGWQIAKLAHADIFVLAFAISGVAHYDVGDTSFDVTQGDIVWFPPGVVHSAYSDSTNPWSFCSVGFQLRDHTGTSTGQLINLPHRLRLPNFYRFAALLEELVHEWTSKRLAYMVRCRAIVEEILFIMIRATDQNEQRQSVPHVFAIHKVTQLIEQQPQKTFAVSDLAKRVNLSESYFRRLFKQITGYTPVQYQHWVKVNLAKDLLLSGQCNVSEAAFQLGFDNVYYFSRLFKRVAGISPSVYLEK